jgi:glycolate oxidase iron-sulfur subunit
MRLTLALDADDLNQCVGCGLCLPHCPTWRVSGEELHSPRGRIAAMRIVEGEGEAGSRFVEAMDGCILCRGCETACPSGVPFGRLMEDTRAALAAQAGYQPRWKRAALAVLGSRALLQAGSRALAIGQRLRLVPGRLSDRLGLPPIPVRQPRLRPSGEDVWLFTGCVMDAWMRETHAATKRVLEAAGAGVALPDRRAACCGALHVHAGLTARARSLAQRTMRAFPGQAPILVDSAGCGAQLKDYGHLLGTPEADHFAARVYDVSEWLAEHAHALPPPRAGHHRPVVAVQDPCHLRHVQRAHPAVRTVLAPYVEIRELDDEGLCCGAGGVFALEHPHRAREVRDRKVAAVTRSGATTVASANPGCILHLRGAGLDVRHPMELVASAIDGSDRASEGGSGLGAEP